MVMRRTAGGCGLVFDLCLGAAPQPEHPDARRAACRLCVAGHCHAAVRRAKFRVIPQPRPDVHLGACAAARADHRLFCDAADWHGYTRHAGAFRPADAGGYQGQADVCRNTVCRIAARAGGHTPDASHALAVFCCGCGMAGVFCAVGVALPAVLLAAACGWEGRLTPSLMDWNRHEWQKYCRLRKRHIAPIIMAVPQSSQNRKNCLKMANVFSIRYQAKPAQWPRQSVIRAAIEVS